ncbi:MAG: site-specific DNA-methyltransferase [Endomicrobium sp.]|jgi:DNA modification methylase|nr:site-specific DNA-methyltransferase [Endomicrobium sp.]
MKKKKSVKYKENKESKNEFFVSDNGENYMSQMIVSYDYKNRIEESNIINRIKDIYSKVEIDYSWSFSNATRKDTTYITHGYHRYPAKFIPQVVSRLITQYTKEGDFVVDPFGGCGTTVLEAKVMGRNSLGVDINPVATLIAKSKMTVIEPKKLEIEFNILKDKLALYNEKIYIKLPAHDRIDYWFRYEEKKELAFILSKISEIREKDIKDFFYCAFSNILKNCSIWMQKSNKPTRDFTKIPSNPIPTFYKQVKMMTRGNQNLYTLLQKKSFSNLSSQVSCNDARKIPVKNNSVDLIVTSPPYVTSYEYADLHQLSTLWFGYAKDLSDFRKIFIGTSYCDENKINLNSILAEQTVENLVQQDKKTAKEVSKYFSDMNQVFVEMKRMLKKGGKTCIVIGNTSLKRVEVLNAEVFTEQLLNLGFKIIDIIKREIPSKNLPSIRDENTGKFASLNTVNKKMIYPTEYILIMEK